MISMAATSAPFRDVDFGQIVDTFHRTSGQVVRPSRSSPIGASAELAPQTGRVDQGATTRPAHKSGAGVGILAQSGPPGLTFERKWMLPAPNVARTPKCEPEAAVHVSAQGTERHACSGLQPSRPYQGSRTEFGQNGRILRGPAWSCATQCEANAGTATADAAEAAPACPSASRRSRRRGRRSVG